MIHQIYILTSDSGLPLVQVDFNEIPNEEASKDTILFSGALTSIRLFLKECKIGDLSNFTTNDKQIEMCYLTYITVAVVADRESPSKKILEDITSDIAAMFISIFKNTLENFNGNLSPFQEFSAELKDFVNLKLEQSREKETKFQPVLNAPGQNSHSIEEWLKNQFSMDAQIDTQKELLIDGKILKMDYILNSGSRKLNRIDKFLARRLYKLDFQDQILVKILDVVHGPAQIKEFLTLISKMGDVDANIDPPSHNWLPSKVIFLGPTVQKDLFENLGRIIKNYKGIAVITPEYVDHIHKDHSPHHAFLRCEISAWQWDLNQITSINVPKKVFP
ncbi:hypothetical protein NEF87_003893 [Candidatus Lokiarchaeum ossiferum]|uniref:Uncharacterized protein n=1 Tax=Candidatus Lokiarchaeum ossiferum TaxID=2951803 RepID=A0ABY6HVQ4_9ARCH|nr:hypothetical protein NEF87_003893 [Candidatus Lokiarchaeum sp. B-35]